MSFLSSLTSGAFSFLQIFASKSTVVTTVDGVAITAGSIESGLGTVGGFIGAFSVAWKAKNYEAEAELSIDEALSVAADLGAPYAGLGATVLPLLWPLINKGIADIHLPPLVPDGRGGFVTQPWAADPREQLNPDGTFKY
jgi:hypothetical protein